MQARLSHVERLNQHQAAKLAKLSQEVDALRAENSILRQSVLEADPEVSDAEDGDGDEDLHTLRRERDQYREQVLAMTKFLHDYGLTWVGDKEQEEETAQLNESLAEKLSRPTSAQVDVQVMCARVEELNALVRQEGAKVVSNRVGGAIHARLATDQAPLPLSFFQDGVKLGRCNFQPFGSRAAQQLLQDILDGYFPYELKEEYPDGVMLKVVDRVAVTFAVWQKEYASADPDLDARGDRLAMGGRVLNAPTVTSSEKVLRAGQICEARPSDRGSAAARGASVPPADEVSLLSRDRDPDQPFARLLVRLDQGLRVVFCLELQQLVGDLEDAVDRWCAEQSLPGLKGCHLRTAFPPQTHADRDQAICDAGLAPSATLFVASEKG